MGSGERPGTTHRKAAQPSKRWVCKRGKVQKRSDTIDQNEHGDPERHSLLTAITNYRSDRGNDDRRCPGDQALHCLSAFHRHRGSRLTVRGAEMAHALRVTLEIGPKGKKVAAVAPDWPGLERGAKTGEAAIARVHSYLPRYAQVAKLAGMEAAFATITTVDVVEQY